MRGRRVLVVGASAGIGAAVGEAVAEAGGKVVISARRQDRLDGLVRSWGSGAAVAADVTDAASVRSMVETAGRILGGLDLVVYVAGFGFLQPLAETDPERWVDIFRVNVIGANLVAGAALDRLDSNGATAFVSSRTVDDANAYFSPYSASKAALDQCIRTWRIEHPERRFVRVVMGNAQPTEFADRMGAGDAMLKRALSRWIEQGINVSHMMETMQAARALVDALASVLGHPEVDSSELKLDARLPAIQRPGSERSDSG